MEQFTVVDAGEWKDPLPITILLYALHQSPQPHGVKLWISAAVNCCRRGILAANWCSSTRTVWFCANTRCLNSEVAPRVSFRFHSTLAGWRFVSLHAVAQTEGLLVFSRSLTTMVKSLPPLHTSFAQLLFYLTCFGASFLVVYLFLVPVQSTNNFLQYTPDPVF